VLFMDEPTSGLDGAATVSLARCLHLLKQTGLTIVCVIHQPRYAVFELFSHLLVLGEGGRQIYCGRREHLVPYFEEIGFKLPPSENPADWLIDVCSGFEERRTSDGTVDADFACPDDLAKEWELKHKSSALLPSSRWHAGDSSIGDAASATQLGYRVTPMWHKAFAHVLSRTAYKIDVFGEIVFACVFVVLGFLGALGPVISDWSWSTHIDNLHGDNITLLLNIVIGMQHRCDFGDEKLLLSREINSGVHVGAVWAARTLKSIIFLAIKVFAMVVVMYGLAPVMQGFFPVYFAYLMSSLWWAAFSQIISLLCRNQMTSIVIVVIVPIFAAIFSGFYCYASAQSMCPFNGFPYNGLAFILPDLNRFYLIYSVELHEFPDYIANFSDVNGTAYRYFEESFYTTTVNESATGPNGCFPPYESFLAQITDSDGDSMYAFSVGMLILWNVLLRLLVLTLLVFMRAATSRRFQNQTEAVVRRLRGVFGICGICRFGPSSGGTSFVAPMDEQLAARKTEFMSKRQEGTSSKGARATRLTWASVQAAATEEVQVRTTEG